MNLEVGMYCYDKTNRKYGIGKIIEIRQHNNYVIEYKNGIALVSSGNIIVSHNIIDLIEVGDYVNGKLVTDIEIHCCDGIDEEDGSKCLFFKNEVYGIYNQDIKTILTKEQFENNCFETGGGR